MNPRAPCLLACIVTSILIAQRPGGPPGAGGPPMRQHRAKEAAALTLVPATEKPPGENEVRILRRGPSLDITSNALPDHLVGRFPNRGNPHHIEAQRYDFRLPADPQPAAQTTWLHTQPAGERGPPNMPFGIALNGVLFDPGTAEFWQGDRALGWNYEALGGAVPLGLDASHAHVQPGGVYHYHGLPTLLMDQLGLAADQHSPLIGWAADGFPIYALRGYKDPQDPASGMKTLRSSYDLKPGERPRPPKGPGGPHDGAFVQDYVFIAGHGDLDECNGRFCVTPDFPRGVYAYFLTAEWPVIPRAFRGTPVVLRGAGGPGGPGRGKGSRPR
ncbi:MAG TPA: hypothetical protein DIT64_22850 [Verrucomicrobiales bacterium]|nr:hypothetical protein [Verrucomicrobiales bacterium]